MLMNWAVIIPLANEQDSFYELSSQLVKILNQLSCGTVYFVVDQVYICPNKPYPIQWNY